jgi:hypothetical protein
LMRDENFASIPTPTYNCVGYAIGDPRWWQPSGTQGEIWPPDLPQNDYRVGRYVELFQRHGFVLCDDEGPAVAIGFEKLAIFGSNGEFEHVAIQSIDGTWISKLGDLEDISHPNESDPLLPLVDFYGEVCHYLKRPGQLNRREGFPLMSAGGGRGSP